MRCASYCLGESYNIHGISKSYTRNNIPHKIYGHDVLHIGSDGLKIGSDGLKDIAENCDIFIFSYGCVVFWNMDKKNENNILSQISKFLFNQSEEKVSDGCTYLISNINDNDYDEQNNKIAYINYETDKIHIYNDNDPYIKLSFSYGMSQSVKLEFFEDSVEKTIKENARIPHELIKTGKMSLSRKSLAKKIGTLFAERNFINLSNNVLDVPEFFWKRPKYEPLYQMSLHNLDMKQRREILNSRLDVIHELYGILSDEIKYVHSSRLEFIIIGLIFIEVLLSVLKDILHLI